MTQRMIAVPNAAVTSGPIMWWRGYPSATPAIASTANKLIAPAQAPVCSATLMPSRDNVPMTTSVP